MNGWLIFLVLVLGYLGLISLLRRRNAPLPGGFEINGPFIFWRTQFGKRALKKIARAERFWNAVADVGIVATWITGIAIFALLIYQVTLYFTQPDVVAQSATPPEFLIGLPGVNPLIPVWYGLAALVIALVIHEGSHGVMAYVGKMRVKSLGLLLFVVPVGAFVEPDEEDLERASTRAKNRVFAAGPSSNLVVALVCGFLLTAMLGSVAVANGGQGLGIGSVEPGTPAEAAGLETGDILLEVNDIRIVNASHFTLVMNGTRANQSVTLDFVRDGTPYQVTARLVDKYDYYVERGVDPDHPEIQGFRGKGFLGMGSVPLTSPNPESAAARIYTPEGRLDLMAHPFADGFPGSFSMGSGPESPPGSFIIYISLPFVVFGTGIDFLAPPYRDFLVVEGPMAALGEPLFFTLAALLYWIVWINIMLGTFNALPAGPLDGGQMFKATLRERLMRRLGVDRSRIRIERQELGGMQMRGADEGTQAKLDRIQGIVSRATWTLGLFILALILLPLFGPHLLQLVR